MFDDEYCASEDSVVLNCDPCQFEGIQQDARAFCHDCNEYLCQQCRQSHHKFQAFRHHNILHGDSMPRSREETKPKLALKLCDDHRMNEVQFYCSTHKSVLCTLCKIAKHLTCECKLIDDICGKDDEAKFYNAVKQIEVMKFEFEQFKTVQNEEIDFTSANPNYQRAQLDSLRKEMYEFFDELENEIMSSELQVKSYVKELRETAEMYTDVINHLASLQEHAEQVSKSNDKVAIFAARSKLEKAHTEYMTVKSTITLKPKARKTKKIMQKIFKVKEMFDNIKHKMMTNITGEENETNMENKDVEICEEKFTDTEVLSKTDIAMNQTEDNKEKSSSYNSNDASFKDKVEETNVDKTVKTDESIQQDFTTEKPNDSKSASARKKPEAQKQEILFDNLKIKNIFYKSIIFEMNDSVCDITGSLFLPDGSLILCDHANSNVILLDKDFHLLHKLHFRGSVWDVALVNNNVIIVTLKYQKLLKYNKVESGRLHEGVGINLKRVPWGIAVYKDHILTTFHNNPGNGVIEVRNRQGKHLRTITADKNEKELFDSPFYVTVNQQNGDVYVTDSRKNSLTCLCFEGKLLYKIESEEFKWPRKVILDDQGNCLLCASFGNKILLIKNKSLQSQEVTGDFRIWLRNCNRPQTVAIRREDQTIIVGQHTANTMFVNNNNNINFIKLKQVSQACEHIWRFYQKQCTM